MILCVGLQFIPDNTIVYTAMDNVLGYHGIQIIYRVSLGTCCSYLFMSILTAIFPFLHHACVFLFTIFYVLFNVLFLWCFKSESFLYTYRTISFYVSAVYLLIQLASLVDGAYFIHEFLSNKMEDYEKRKGYKDGESPICANQYKLFYLTLSFLLIVLALGFNIWFYFLFKSEEGLCQMNATTISISIVLGIIALVGSLFSPANAGILPPAVFFLCITFYLYIALISNPDNACNPFIDVHNVWVEVINIILCLGIASYYAMRIQPEYTDESLHRTKDVELGKNEVSLQDEDSRLPALYHLTNAILSIYLCNLTTFWYDGDLTIFPNLTTKSSTTITFWIFNASFWVGFFLYLWTDRKSVV